MHHILRHSRLPLAGAIVAALALTACAGPNSGGTTAPTGAAQTADWGKESGTIEFWDTNANPVLSKKWAELITQFEAKYPAIKVKYVGLPNSSYLQKVDNALATGQVPDVMLVGNDLAGFVAQNAMAPLDKAYDADLASVMDPTMAAGVRSKAPDNHLYAAPLTALSDVLWYRTDWLAKKGIKPPTSYDQFFEDAKLVTDKSANRFGFAFRGGAGSIPPLMAMTYGISGVGEFFTKDGKSTLADPANVAAMKRYVSLYGNESATADLTNDYPKIVAEFDGGSAWAMHHNLGSYQSHIKALGAANVVGVQPFPNAKGVITATSPALSGLGIFQASKHKAAAWDFVKFMSTTGDSSWSEASGQLPANIEAAKAPWVQSSQPLKAIVEAAKNPKTQYVQLPVFLPDWGPITKTKMEPDLQSVLQGTMSVQAFTSKYATLFEKALVDYKAHAKK
jgi:multiple sugar transport system substrate-binding protein